MEERPRQSEDLQAKTHVSCVVVYIKDREIGGDCNAR